MIAARARDPEPARGLKHHRLTVPCGTQSAVRALLPGRARRDDGEGPMPGHLRIRTTDPGGRP